MLDTGEVPFTPPDNDHTIKVSLYQQVNDLLLAEIKNKTIALNELALAGVVRRQRRIGTIMIHDVAASQAGGSFQTTIDESTLIGGQTEIQLLDQIVKTACPTNSKTSDLKGYKCVRRITRLHRQNAEPFCYNFAYTP